MPTLISFLFNKREYKQRHLESSEDVLKLLKGHAWLSSSLMYPREEVRCQKVA